MQALAIRSAMIAVIYRRRWQHHRRLRHASKRPNPDSQARAKRATTAARSHRPQASVRYAGAAIRAMGRKMRARTPGQFEVL
jgi:hypothetical protein